MTTLADQIERIQWLTQDRDASATNLAKIMLQHQEELARLARHGCFPQITWLQGVAAQALYGLPTNTAQVTQILYNQQVLRYVTEGGLDRSKPGWERLTGEPTYWTMDDQNPTTVRLIPPPTRTGSAVPVMPALPLAMDPVDNLLVFHTEDLAITVASRETVLPTMADSDDVLVYATAAGLTRQEKAEQNLAVAAACDQLAALWMQLLGKG